MTPEIPGRLARLGDALETAAAADLRAAGRRRPVGRRIALAAATLAVLVPTAAIAADRLISDEEVGASMPAGALELQGTDPVCTPVRGDVEWRCRLTRPPRGGLSSYLGTVYQTVDATQHVNGGCRSLRADGMEWRCYLGQAAVDQKIISQDFLGEVQTGPAVG